MKSEKQIENAVERVMTLPEKEQVKEMVRILEVLPEEGRKLVVAYYRITRAESLTPA